MSEENLKACEKCGNTTIQTSQYGLVFCRQCGNAKKSRKQWNTRQSPESKKIEEAIKSINHLAEAVDNYELDDEEFSDNLILDLARIKNELKSILEGGES